MNKVLELLGELGQSPHEGPLAQLLAMVARREPGDGHPRGTVLVRGSDRCDRRPIADRHVVQDPRSAAEHAIVPDPRTPGDSRLRHEHAVPPAAYIIRYLDLTINFRPRPDH